jgi:hypothetical protein
VITTTAAKGIGGSSTPEADAAATDTGTADTAAAAKDEDVELAAHEPAELQAELQEELQEEALAPTHEDDMDVEVAAIELEGIVPALKLAINMLNAGGECSTDSAGSVVICKHRRFQRIQCTVQTLVRKAGTTGVLVKICVLLRAAVRYAAVLPQRVCCLRAYNCLHKAIPVSTERVLFAMPSLPVV